MAERVERATSPNSAGPRLRRLLSMIPWLAANDGPSVAEVCQRYGLTEKQLQADLDLLTYYVGIPPYTPDTFFDMTIRDGRVFAEVTPSLDRPLRLSPAEGLALVAAGSALIDRADPQGPLATGLAKIGALLGLEAGDEIAVDLGNGDPAVRAVLEGAVDAGVQVSINHHNDARGEWLERVVDPWEVSNVGGIWYLTGFDHLRGAQRSFRFDRIQAARRLDTEAAPVPTDLSVNLQPSQSAPRVVLDLAASARWVVEAYPVDEVEPRPDGRLRVTLAVNSRAWFARLLLRLGPAVTIVESPVELQTAGVEVAQEMLARYRASAAAG